MGHSNVMTNFFLCFGFSKLFICKTYRVNISNINSLNIILIFSKVFCRSYFISFYDQKNVGLHQKEVSVIRSVKITIRYWSFGGMIRVLFLCLCPNDRQRKS